MGLVKKLANGGEVQPKNPIIYDDSAIAETMNKYDFTSKDSRKVWEALGKIKDWAKDSSGKNIEFDPSGSYTVTGPGSEIFQGSSEGVSKDWLTGRPKIGNDAQKAMSAAMAIYREAHHSPEAIAKSSGQPTTSLREKATIGDLGDYALEKHFGTAENYTRTIAPMKSDNERKQLAFNIAQEQLTKYIENAQKNSDKLNYVDLDSAHKLLSTIKSGDWDKFVNEASLSFKWNPTQFLLSEQDKKDIADAELYEKQKADAEAAAKSQLEANLLAEQKRHADNLIIAENKRKLEERAKELMDKFKISRWKAIKANDLARPERRFNEQISHPFTSDLSESNAYFSLLGSEWKKGFPKGFPINLQGWSYGSGPQYIKFKQGGIIKAANGTTLYGGNKVDLSIAPVKKGNLYYGQIDKSGKDWRFNTEGKYTPEYLNTINNLDENWFNQNKDRIQNAISGSKSSFVLKDLPQLKRLATDYKPGILHNIINESLPKPVLNIPTSKPATTSGVGTIDTGKGVIGTIKDVFKKGSIDTTDLANTAMLLNSINANKSIGNLQRQALTQSSYTLPYIPKQYIRSTSMLGSIGENLATNLSAKANRVASSTSDIDKSMGALFTGNQQANDIRSKYNLAATDELNKQRAQQLTSDYRTDLANTETLAKNRALNADIIRKLYLTTANEKIAQNTSLNNFITAYVHNLGTKQAKIYTKALYEAYSDPKLQSLQKSYSDLISDEEASKREDAYNELVKTSGANMPSWRESEAYKAYGKEISDKAKSLELMMEPIKKLQLAQYYQQPIYKSGGSLSKEDKLEIEAFKDENKRNLKDAEITFKSILHNNEILQKALIKVFK